MSFTGLYLNDAGQPVCNQPVPLRLVPLITDWSCCLVLELLGDGIGAGDRVLFPLEPFIYDKTASPKTKHHSFYADLKRSALGSGSSEQCLSTIPPNHFMWSDNIVTAFTTFIDLAMGREDAYDAGLSLLWAPDTSHVEDDIRKCSDFKELLPKTLINASETEQQYEKWLKRRSELIDSKHHKYFKGAENINESEIAGTIAKEAGLGKDHVRKMIRMHRKD